MKFLLEEIKFPKKIDYFLYFIIVAICYIIYIYSDALVHIPFSVNLWNVHLLNFNYEVYMRVGSYHYSHWPYFSYILYSILFFPLWVYTKIFNFTLYTWHHENFSIGIFELMYIKTVLFLFLLGSSSILYKIAKELKIQDNDSKLSKYLFLSSPFTILPTLFISQLDIITIYFMLLGILYYVKNDNKYLLWFAISICLKNYPTFILFPLILLREKKLKTIIFYNVIAVAPFIITNMITKIADIFYYHNPPLPDIPAKDIYSEVFSWLLGNKIANIPVFLILYSIICIYCYLKPKNDDNFLSINIIFITFVSFLFSHISVPLYRMVVLSPFISLLLIINSQKLCFNIFIEFISSFFYSISLLITGTYVSLSEATRTYSIPIIKFFYNKRTFKYNNISDFITILKNHDIYNFIYSIIFISLFALVFMFYTLYQKRFEIINNDKEIIKRYLLYIRYIPTLLVIVSFLLLLIINN